MPNDIPDGLLFSSAFPLPFRVLCLTGLGILGWATNLHGLRLVGIDSASVLELHGHRAASQLPFNRASSRFMLISSAAYAPIYRLFIAYYVFTLSAWLLFRYATHGDLELVDTFKFIPAIAALSLLMLLVCPFNIFQRHERDKFLYSIQRCLFPPANHRIHFADIVFADAFTSFAKVLGDIWLSFCMLVPGGSLFAQPTQEGLSRWILPTLMSVPYAVRLRQCLIEFRSPTNGSRRPLYNALKYASSFPVIYLSAAQRIVVSDLVAVKGEAAVREAWHGEHQLFRLWLLAAVVNSLYSFWWDVTHDWGFDLLLPRGPNARSRSPPRPSVLPRLHSLTRTSSSLDDGSREELLAGEKPPSPRSPASEYPRYPFGLRPTLLFPLAVYPFAILADLVLRLTWSVKLSSHLHSYAEGDLVIFWIELAEVVRRWMWVFIRVEWELVRNAHARRPSPRRGADDAYEMVTCPPIAQEVPRSNDEGSVRNRDV